MEEGRVKEIVLEEDHEQVVTGKIVKIFPKLLSQENSPPFHYMYVTSSGDIKCAELPEDHTGWDSEAAHLPLRNGIHIRMQTHYSQTYKIFCDLLIFLLSCYILLMD